MAEDFVETITNYIDQYLIAKANERQIEKKRLFVYMKVTKHNLMNYLYEDNSKLLGMVTIKDVIGLMAAFLAGKKIENKIIEGFHEYSKKNQLICENLKLGLFYNADGKLIYQAYYDKKPIDVNLVEFFKK